MDSTLEVCIERGEGAAFLDYMAAGSCSTLAACHAVPPYSAILPVRGMRDEKLFTSEGVQAYLWPFIVLFDILPVDIAIQKLRNPVLDKSISMTFGEKGWQIKRRSAEA